MRPEPCSPAEDLDCVANKARSASPSLGELGGGDSRKQPTTMKVIHQYLRAYRTWPRCVRPVREKMTRKTTPCARAQTRSALLGGCLGASEGPRTSEIEGT